jgi:hypothetical protein
LHAHAHTQQQKWQQQHKCGATIEAARKRRTEKARQLATDRGQSLPSFISLTSSFPSILQGTQHDYNAISQNHTKASAPMSRSIFNKLQSGLNYLDGAFKETMEGDEEGGEEELVEQRRQVRKACRREGKGGKAV